MRLLKFLLFIILINPIIKKYITEESATISKYKIRVFTIFIMIVSLDNGENNLTPLLNVSPNAASAIIVIVINDAKNMTAFTCFVFAYFSINGTIVIVPSDIVVSFITKIILEVIEIVVVKFLKSILSLRISSITGIISIK